MRRVTYLGALVTALAFVATPVSAQTQPSLWSANGQVGTAFGSPGATPAAAFSAGLNLRPDVSVVGEFGAFRDAPFADLRSPAVGPITNREDEKGTALHLNANPTYRMPETARVTPYLTAGAGTFIAPILVNGPFGTGSTEVDHDPMLAANLGGGLTVRLNRWLGVTADYRYFAVNADDLEHVNRFWTGLAIFLR